MRPHHLYNHHAPSLLLQPLFHPTSPPPNITNKIIYYPLLQSLVYFLQQQQQLQHHQSRLSSPCLPNRTGKKKVRSHLSLLDSGLTPPESYQANCKFRSWLFETQSKSWINHLNGPGFTTTLTISATPYPKETRWTRPLWIHFHCSDNKNV